MKDKVFLVWLFAAIVWSSCGSSSPLDRLKDELSSYPEYSIILQDMREDGNFFTEYYHKYKIIRAEEIPRSDSLDYREEETRWYRVKDNEFKKYANLLGMVLVSKGKEGNVSENQRPPGYEYVGDTRYGQWRTDSSGNTFWEWYGKYAFFSSMFGMFSGPVYRRDWDTYRDYDSSGRTYYGRNNQYGTNGTATKRSNSTFFDRQKERQAARQSAFSQKVKERTTRSNMSGYRSRSGGSGK
jgi:hypothetical protein